MIPATRTPSPSQRITRRMTRASTMAIDAVARRRWLALSVLMASSVVVLIGLVPWVIAPLVWCVTLWRIMAVSDDGIRHLPADRARAYLRMARVRTEWIVPWREDIARRWLLTMSARWEASLGPVAVSLGEADGLWVGVVSAHPWDDRVSFEIPHGVPWCIAAEQSALVVILGSVVVPDDALLHALLQRHAPSPPSSRASARSSDAAAGRRGDARGSGSSDVVLQAVPAWSSPVSDAAAGRRGDARGSGSSDGALQAVPAWSSPVSDAAAGRRGDARGVDDEDDAAFECDIVAVDESDSGKGDGDDAEFNDWSSTMARNILTVAQQRGLQLKIAAVQRGRQSAVLTFQWAGSFDSVPTNLQGRVETLRNDLPYLIREIACSFSDSSIRFSVSLPNRLSRPFLLSDLLDQMAGAPPYSVVIGERDDGTPLTVRFDESPHMLVAGMTGTGKTTFVQSLIAALVATLTPRQAMIGLLDLKQSSFTEWSAVPHLFAPIAVDGESAIRLLRAAECEMRDRHRAAHRSRDATPKLFVVIDEMADLMTNHPEARAPIAAIAQMGRSVGVHLICATQHPTADVIDRHVKSNMSVCVAFRTATQVASRVVLDAAGAERLPPRGVMLVRCAGETALAYSACPDVHEIRAVCAGARSPDAWFSGAWRLSGGDVWAWRALLSEAVGRGLTATLLQTSEEAFSPGVRDAFGDRLDVIDAQKRESAVAVHRVITDMARGRAGALFIEDWDALSSVWGGVVIQDAHGHREQAVALLRRRIERWSVQARPGAPIWVAGSAAGAGGAVEPPPSVPAAPLWPLR